MSLSQSSTPTRPFEWLTSVESLREHLAEALRGQHEARVVHVGCGSSVVGEFLLQEFGHQVAQVINVDNDANVLQAMQERWQTQCQESNDKPDKMKFMAVDLCQHNIPLADGSCDVVIDKSTLDCLLCSDQGASSLIAQVHRLLHPQRGTYLLISFHNMHLLRPLLEQCPGSDWTFTHKVMYRHVEALPGSKIGGEATTTVTNLAHVEVPTTTTDDVVHSSAWTSQGHFCPDEVYHRTVNVLVGRRQGTADATRLDPDAVYAHVNRCSNDWYQQQNPMLTAERTHQIRKAFAEEGPLLGLPECYQALFTAQEREHFTYQDFCEDWTTFLESHADLAKDQMSSETALQFLSEMQ